MDELTTRKTQLPDTLEDLSQFVLVNKAKLDAYRVKLRAVNRLSDAQEIREQTLQEMQDISSALIAAETRIGEILLSIPKNTSYHGNQHQEVTSNGVENTKNKSEVTEEMGYTRHEVSDYQRMAQNPAVVNYVLEQAEREGRVVSHAEVMRKIKAKDAEIEKLSRDRDSAERAARSFAKQVNQGGRVIEKIVEVVPDDYEETKKQLQMNCKHLTERRKSVNPHRRAWITSRLLHTTISADTAVTCGRLISGQMCRNQQERTLQRLFRCFQLLHNR